MEELIAIAVAGLIRCEGCQYRWHIRLDPNLRLSNIPILSGQ